MVYTLRFFSLQSAVCSIILTYLVPVVFTFYIQGVLKLKKIPAPLVKAPHFLRRTQFNALKLICYQWVSLLSCPWPRQLPQDVPADASLLYDRADVILAPVNGRQYASSRWTLEKFNLKILMFWNTNSDPTPLYYLWANLLRDPLIRPPLQREGDFVSGSHRRVARSAATGRNPVSEKVCNKN